MRRALAFAAVAAALTAALTGTAVARQKRILVLTQTAAFRHDSIPFALAQMQALGRRSRRYDVVPLMHGVTDITARRLRSAAALVFLSTSGELPLTSRQKAEILRFVRRGGGFLGVHAASDTFHTTWPAYKRMLGAEFKRHDPVAEGTIRVEDRSNPATRRLPRRFRITDEFYEFVHDPRSNVHVLASLADPAGRDLPLVWCRQERRGRVFYDALGHPVSTWQNTYHRRLIAGALAWVAGLAGGPCRTAGG